MHRCVSVRARPFGLVSLPSSCVLRLQPVAAMASSDVDLLLAHCLAVGLQVSERKPDVPQPFRAAGKSDTSIASRVRQVICWNRVSQGIWAGAGGDVSSSSADILQKVCNVTKCQMQVIQLSLSSATSHSSGDHSPRRRAGLGTGTSRCVEGEGACTDEEEARPASQP